MERQLFLCQNKGYFCKEEIRAKPRHWDILIGWVFSFQFWNIDLFFLFFRVFIFSFLVKTTILAWADNIFINYNTDSWNFYCVVVNLKTILLDLATLHHMPVLFFFPLCKITACRLLPHKHKFVLANDKWWFRWVFKGKTLVDIHCWTIFFHK